MAARSGPDFPREVAGFSISRRAGRMTRGRRAGWLWLACGLLLLLPPTPTRGAQGEGAKPEAGVATETKTATEETRVGRAGLLGLVRATNPMVWPLALCSVVTLGFALERWVALRRSRVLPRGFVEKLLERIGNGTFDRERALEYCRSHEHAAARVLGGVVSAWGQPSPLIRGGTAAAVASEAHEMMRNVRVLNGSAALAPLLGLLGTVIGLIESFDALGGRGQTGQGKSEQLAHGISLALMATAVGLGIAIVAVTFYYFHRNRVD